MTPTAAAPPVAVPKDEHADAASIGYRARSTPVEHQQSECDRHVGDVHQENAACHVGESGRRPEVPHQLHAPVQVPRHHHARRG